MGVVFIVLGGLANQWILSRIFAPDGQIESPVVAGAIGVFQALMIGLGVVFIYFRQHPTSQRLADVAVGLALTIACLFGFDWLLGVSGFPGRYIPPLAHPADQIVVVNNLEFAYTVQTNRKGIRNRDLPDFKRPGTQRVVVVGDSYVEGVGVELDETFVSRLEQRLSTYETPVEFINCGLAATWPIHYARILFHLCLDYDPDVVIIAIFANDVTETVVTALPEHIDAVNLKTGLYRALHSLWPHLYTLVETGLINRKNETAPEADPSSSPAQIDMLKAISQEARSLGLTEDEIAGWQTRLAPTLVAAVNRGEFNGQLLSAGLLRPDYWLESLDIEGEVAEQKFQVMMAVLDETVTRLQGRDVPVGIVFIPSPFQYDPGYGDVWRQSGVQTRRAWTETESEIERRLTDWAMRRKLPFFNLTPDLRIAHQNALNGTRHSRNGALHYAMDGHWTPAGHGVAATLIASWLETWAWR